MQKSDKSQNNIKNQTTYLIYAKSDKSQNNIYLLSQNQMINDDIVNATTKFIG